MFRRGFILLTFFLASTPIAFAQVSGLPGIAGSATLTLSPQYPGPGDHVQVTLRAPLLHLEGATILWFRDSKPVTTLPGATTIEVDAGPLGSQIDIAVEIHTTDGVDAEAETTITSASLDLLYEAKTYVPPFYRGRALATAGTAVSLHAIPWFKTRSGTFIPKSDITFTWRRGAEIISGASGLGKDTATIPLAPFSRNATLSVEATSADHTFTSRSSIQVPTLDPKILLYEDHPLFGILYNAALSPQTNITDSELTVHALPLFAPTQNEQDPQLIYDWSVDAHPVASSTFAREITLRPKSGSALVSLDISHNDNIFYTVSQQWRIMLNQKNTAPSLGGLFGPKK